MSRSVIQLRRILFGVSCAVVFGLGATEASAERTNQPVILCMPGDPGTDAYCTSQCSSQTQGTPWGTCQATGQCTCSQWPIAL